MKRRLILLLVLLVLFVTLVYAATHDEGADSTVDVLQGDAFSDQANCTAEIIFGGSDCWVFINNRNENHEGRWGFDGLTSADIPSGSTINSVTCLARAQREYGNTLTVIELKGYNNNTPGYISCDGGSTKWNDTNTSDTTEYDYDCILSSTPSYADLVTNHYIDCALEFNNGNDGDEELMLCDAVYMQVDYTESGGGRTRRVF